MITKIKHKIKNLRYKYKRKKALKQDTLDFFDNYKNYFSQKEFLKIYESHLHIFKERFLYRIHELIPNFGNKKYTVEFLLGQILRENVEEKDCKKFFEYNAYAFLFCYEKKWKEIKDYINNKRKIDLFSDSLFQTKFEHIKKLMIDALEVIQYLEVFYGHNPEQEILINRKISGTDIFWYTNLMSNGIVDTSNDTYYSNLAYLIRHSLEIRIKNALGIIDIKNNEETCKITSDIFTTFLCTNSNIQLPSSINKSLLEKIFIWTNYHIHLGIRLYNWDFLLILEYISPLFEGGKNNNQISIYGSISMKKNYYQLTLSSDLVHYLTSLGKTVTNVILSKSPECMLI